MKGVRLVLRALLGRDAYERAVCDLDDVARRVTLVRGARAAERAWLREAAAVVVWSVLDRVRGALDVRRRRAVLANRRSDSMVRNLFQEIRLGARALGRRPGFTMVAVVVLALGIGANATIFTLANRLFLDPPGGVVEPRELVRVFRTTGSFVGGAIGYPDYLDYRAGAPSFAGLGAIGGAIVTAVRWTGGGPVEARVGVVSENWFDVLGVRPAAGRFFRDDENSTLDAHPVAVLSWGFWRDRLGGDPGIIGNELLLNGRAFTVVGVAPREYRGIEPGRVVMEIFIPILMRNAVAPSADHAWWQRMPDVRDNWLVVIGRLRPGATVESAQAEVSAIAAGIYPPRAGRDPQGVFVTDVLNWTPGTHRDLRRLVQLLAAAVATLLAVATANAAILLLARASARERELGIRVALGAGRLRVLRHLLTESMLLSVAGAALGLLLAVGAVRVASALLPVRLEPAPTPDVRVVLATLVLSALTALLAALPPIVRFARSDPAGAIQGRTRHAGGGRARDALVVLQVALSLVLVTGAALFARSLTAAQSVDIGFDTRDALVVNVNLAPRGYTGERGRAFMTEALQRIAALPGVESAAAARQAPFRGEWSTTLRTWPGAAFAGGGNELDVGLNAVTAGYFETIGIPILRGRGILASDVEGSEPVVVVNETFARLAFPEGDALGRTVPIRGPDGPAFRIVGIARDADYYAFAEETRNQVYGSLHQAFGTTINFIVRTGAAPQTVVAPLREVLRTLDPDLAIVTIETLDGVYREQLASYRTSANVVGLTGLIALLLASAGLYGVMAYRVAERTREIGVRMALGESKRSVAGVVVGRGLRLTLMGVALGVSGALALGPLVQGLLFGVPARDPVALLLAPAVLLAVGLLAMLVPARRAMTIDPMRAIRSD